MSKFAKFECDACEKTFTRKDALKRHLKCCTGAKSGLCPYCQLHIDKDLGRHTARCARCKKCKKQFQSQNEKESHVCKNYCRNCQTQFGCDADHNLHPCQSTYACDICLKTYPYNKKREYERHVELCGRCKRCCSKPQTRAEWFRHNCGIRKLPNVGGANSRQGQRFRAHQQWVQKPKPIPEFGDVDETHLDVATQDILDQYDGVLEELLDVIKNLWSTIRSHHTSSSLQQKYNFRVTMGREGIIQTLWHIFRSQTQSFKIAASFGYVLRDKETGDLTYFFPSKNNNGITDNPLLISNKTDFETFLELFREFDPKREAIIKRPNTKYEVVYTPNVTVWVYATPKISIRGGDDDGGDFLGVGKRANVGGGGSRPNKKHKPDHQCEQKPQPDLEFDGVDETYLDTPTPDNDDGDNFRGVGSMCVFNCLHLHMLKKDGMGYKKKKADQELADSFRMIKSLAREFVMQNLHLYPDRTVEQIVDSFPGVMLHDLHLVEDLFQVSINIYEKMTHYGTDRLVASLVRRGDVRFKENLMCVQMVRTGGGFHCEYIDDMDEFAKHFSCQKCGYHFHRKTDYQRHVLTCKGKTRYTYSKGYYDPEQYSLYKQLKRYGVKVQKKDLMLEYLTVYDCESILCKSENTYGNMGVEHIVCSISVYSNVPGFKKPVCFVIEDEDVDDLVWRFVEYVEEISYFMGERVQLRLEKLITQLTELSLKMKEKAMTEKQKSGASGDTDIAKNPYDTLLDRLLVWTKQMPVVGFNSAKYDLGLLTRPLFRILASPEEMFLNPEKETLRYHDPRHDVYEEMVSEDDGVESPHATIQDAKKRTRLKRVIKRGNAFMTIETNTLRFLDVCNFNAPGISLSQYLEAFGVEDKKSYFCYEYLDSFDKLKETQLPPYEAFYSTLKLANVLEMGVGEGLNPETVGRQRYVELQDIWRTNKFKTLQDFLVYYNNLDVVGLLHALDKQRLLFKKYFDQCMLTSAYSLAGIALNYCFSIADGRFRHICEADKDFYKKVQHSMVGGPSILFHRLLEVDKSYICHDADMSEVDQVKSCHLVKSIIGYDCNSLYLYTMGLPMPSGDYVVRKAENGFQREKRHPASCQSDIALEWLGYLEKTRKRFIAHAGNGPEIRVGPKKSLVDGFEPATQTVFEYNGCHWHACVDCFRKKYGEYADPSTVEHPKCAPKTYAQVRKETSDKEEYLRNIGLTVESMWDCQWRQEKGLIRQQGKDVLINSNQHPPNYLPKKPTEADILQAVVEDKLFGFIEVDIEVPEALRPKFEQFPPVFKHAEVTIDDVGDVMGDYCKRQGYLKRPSKLLISSFFAQKMFLATPLLKWYLAHGLVVTTIYSVMEFTPRVAFEKLVTTVSDRRRAGDRDSEGGVLARMAKDMGNSSIGKLQLNKEKYNQTHIADLCGATHLLQNIHFKSIDMIDENLYIVECSPSRIHFDKPIQIANFVYNYAKLRMLEFVYDCVFRFIPQSKVKTLYMDTDSFYCGFGAKSLEQCVPPELKIDFYNNYRNFFPSPVCSQHWDQYVKSKIDPENSVPVPDGCQDCVDTVMYEKRTPGLFKVEFDGAAFVGLNSKTYWCEGDVSKHSCKGVQKKRNPLAVQNYKKVLETQEIHRVENMGFRVKSGRMFTYTQEKHGLTPFYAKRRVLSDGVSTKTLHL